MKPSDLFGVVVRTIGLVLMGVGLWRLFGALATTPYVTITAGGREIYSWPVMLFLVLLLVLAAGAVCFFRADWIVQLAYAERRPDLAASSNVARQQPGTN